MQDGTKNKNVNESSSKAKRTNALQTSSRPKQGASAANNKHSRSEKTADSKTDKELLVPTIRGSASDAASKPIIRNHNTQPKAAKQKKKKTYVVNKAPKPNSVSNHNRPKQPIKKSTVIKAALASLMLVLICTVAVLYFVCNVTTISVKGNSMFSENEIVNLSGLFTGKNLFLYDLKAAKKAVESNPYISCESIKRLFPHELCIEITEHDEYAAIVSSGGVFCIIDREGTVLDVGRRQSIDGLIAVYGLGSMGFTTGSAINSDKTKLRPYTLVEIIDALGERNDSIKSIDLSNSASLKIVTTDGVTVMLGDSIHIEDKINCMFNAIKKADQDKLDGALIYINSNGTADISYHTPTLAEPDKTDEPDVSDEPVSTENPDDAESSDEPDVSLVSDSPSD